jgi:hypothetical protein
VLLEANNTMNQRRLQLSHYNFVVQTGPPGDLGSYTATESLGLMADMTTNTVSIVRILPHGTSSVGTQLSPATASHVRSRASILPLQMQKTTLKSTWDRLARKWDARSSSKTSEVAVSLVI